MDTRKCQVLLKVLECGSMAGAAEIFGYDPSGISRMIASMERETGFALLVRGKNGLSLTKGGERLLPVIQEIFPAPMAGVTPEMLYAAVNKSEPSLIRTEADELTYGNHVMIRYEMEKLMFSGDVKVAELPGLWNEMYRKYLGVEVPDDRRGILQDSHWSGGAFGYFPSYALGSAYGVQMLTAMEKDVPDLWQRIEKGDLSPATAWLKEKIHRFGRVLTPAQLLENSIGGPFDPTCYTDYLTRKFTDLYRL